MLRLAVQHPYIIGYILLSVGLHPLLDVYVIVSRLAFFIVWLLGIIMRGGMSSSILSAIN